MRRSTWWRWCPVWLTFVMAACYASPSAELGVKPGLRLEADESVAANVPSNLPGLGWTHHGSGPVVARSENAFTSDDAADTRGTAGGVAGTDPAVPAAPPAGRMLVQRGELHLEVARPDDASKEFLARVQAVGGYLKEQNGTAVTVRLPVARFEEVVAMVRTMGRVVHESRQAEDVTEEFVDLGLRLDNAKRSRDRLLEILAKAERVEDILKVEAELRRLTEEIERMEGRRKFLADQVAMATLTVAWQGPATAAPSPQQRQRSRFGWINAVGAEVVRRAF